MDPEKKYLKEEIRKEFQLERMILFSDAVFAIVVTLMAIEIRIPESSHLSDEEFSKSLLHLIPVFVAYVTTFFFIGTLWYEHLRIFSLLKDYNKGLVVRNLIMLFLIGLFPFSVTVMARPQNTLMLRVVIYFSVIIACKASQLVLNHYILVKSPQLRINADVHEELIRFKRSCLIVSLLVVIFVLILVSSALIENPMYKPFVWWWFVPLPFVMRYLKKKIK